MVYSGDVRMGSMSSRDSGFLSALPVIFICLVLLGILAIIVVPPYMERFAVSEAMDARIALENFRGEISYYFREAQRLTGKGAWPSIDSLPIPGVVWTKSGWIKPSKYPKNPYQLNSNAPDSVVTGMITGVIVGTRGGWAYNPSTGEIWPNTEWPVDVILSRRN